MPRLSLSTMEALRASVRPEYAEMDAMELEQLVEDAVSGLPEQSAESVWSALGSVGKKVAPVLQRAAPSMVQGAASGATVGGPWGALLGAGAGLASSALGGKSKPAATSPAAPAGAAARALPRVPGLPSGQGAAAMLFGLMDNSAVRNAIASQIFGSTGDQGVVAPSGARIPRGAVNNLLMQLLAGASEALDESESVDEQAYLRGEDGEYIADPASPEQQAAAVLAHLTQPSAGAPAAESDEWIGDDVLAMGDDVEFAGEIESVDFY
jgi:hypothetical protein